MGQSGDRKTLEAKESQTATNSGLDLTVAGAVEIKDKERFKNYLEERNEMTIPEGLRFRDRMTSMITPNTPPKISPLILRTEYVCAPPIPV